MDDALGDEHVDRSREEVDIKRGADGADVDVARLNDEGACGVCGDGEMRFAV